MAIIKLTGLNVSHLPGWWMIYGNIILPTALCDTGTLYTLKKNNVYIFFTYG